MLAAGSLCFVAYFMFFAMRYVEFEWKIEEIYQHIAFGLGTVLLAFWLFQVLIVGLLYYICRIAALTLKVAVKLADKHLAKQEV